MFRKRFAAVRSEWRNALIAAVLLAASSVMFCSQQEDGSASSATPEDEISIFIAGDAIITQPWSHKTEPDFLQLINEVQGADVSVVNLEMLITDFEGYPQTQSGGTYMNARPVIAKELIWAGFDMVGSANNHSFDYGSIGVLKTVENVEKAGLVIAGVGKDMQTARAPQYFRHPKGTIALVSNAETFTGYGIAGYSRPDLHGRPGLNPLTVTSRTVTTIKRSSAEKLQKLAEEEGIPGVSISQGRGGERFRFMGQNYQIGDESSSTTSRIVDQKDLEENLESIRKAEANADVVVLSIHAHRQGAWLQDFAHQAIDAGVDVFFGHGPHRVLGIEIYRGKPIFYSLGDFVFQNEQIELLPSEFYANYGLGDDATPEDAQNARSNYGTRGFPVRQYVWEGIAATINFKDGEVTEIRIIPVDMGFGEPLPIRGMPKYANGELGKKIINEAISQSSQYGTEIEYIAGENIGRVIIK